MKTPSQKKAESDWRKAFLLRVGRCDFCRQQYGLSLHELGRARGVNRQAALTEESCLLVLCLSNPATGRIGCHEKCQNEPELVQLALQYLHANARYNLKDYLRVTSPRAPHRLEQVDVDRAADALNHRWRHK